jgi:hypothetical protein
MLLSTFLLVWVILLVIYGVLTLLTLIQMLRHGLPGFTAYISTFLFLLVTLGVVVGTSLYWTTVDWTQTVDVSSASILRLMRGEPSV